MDRQNQNSATGSNNTKKKNTEACHFKEIRKWFALQGTPSFLWLILNWVGRIVYSNEAGGYIGVRVAVGSITLAGGLST
jgi:hypothetical protein